MNYTL